MSKVLYNPELMVITVDSDEVRRALGDLQAKTPAVMKVAVNATAREARRMMVKSAKKRYDLSRKGIEKIEMLHQRGKATNQNPTAELYIGGPRNRMRNDLAYFHTNPSVPYMGTRVFQAPKHFRGRVLKASPMQDLGGSGTGKSKAFLVKFTSGHVGMVERQAGTSGPALTQTGKRRWKPNNKLYTLGSASARGVHNTVWKEVEPEVERVLEERLERRIRKVMARAGRST